MKRIPLIITLAVLAACLSLEFTRLIKKPWPPLYFSDPEVHFKYGSIGAEVNGYPFFVWRELPTLFRERIPKGWREFGFIYEGDRTLPIGISVRRTGVPRVGFNCATCHTSAIIKDDNAQVLLGAPASQLDIQAYLAFLDQASRDPALTPDAIFRSAADAGRAFSWYNKLLYRYIVIPRLREEEAGLRAQLAWMKSRAAHGPGRTDAGNVWRSRWGLQPENDALVGTVDFPSVWNQRLRADGWFHWDGNNSSLEERNYSAALAGEATDWLLDRRSIKRVSDWLTNLPPPKFPWPVDSSKAQKGGVVYQREGCGNCHDKASGQVGQVTDLAVIQTDPERVKIFTPEIVERFHKVGSAYSWRFSHYRSTNGYVNMPLDGVWARSPYLHNGSVPTLAALFSKEEARPSTFFRGCGTFDIVNVGYVCARGFELSTKLIGNSNKGHTFGTLLGSEEKLQLIEYLKTL